MNEVEKMYENAEVEPINFAKQGAIDFTNTIEIDGKRYPDFTAEKQLELIKWYISSVWWLNLKALDFYIDMNLSFEEKLAKLTNRLWKDMTENQRKQVKGILE